MATLLMIFVLCFLLPGYWKVLVIAIGIGVLLLPVDGFIGPECIAEYRVLKLRRKNEDIYVETTENVVVFAIDESSRYDLGGDAYAEKKVYKNFKVYESEKCKVPIVKVFKRVPLRGCFSLTPFFTKIEYVFYVPRKYETDNVV